MRTMLHAVIDEVAENMQGLLGVRIKIGTVSPIIPEYNKVFNAPTSDAYLLAPINPFLNIFE